METTPKMHKWIARTQLQLQCQKQHFVQNGFGVDVLCCAVLCYAVCLLSMWNSRTNEIEMTSITVTSPVYGQSLHSNCNRNQIHNRAFWTHFRILGIIKWRLVWFSLVCTSKDYNRQFNFICINSSVWLWHIFNWFTWFFVQMKCKLLEFVVFYQWQNLPAKIPPFIHISSILWRCHPIIHSKSIRGIVINW